MSCQLSASPDHAKRTHPGPRSQHRWDLKKITVPTLILHGDDDQIVPIDNLGRLSAKIVKNTTLKVYPGASHGVCVINADQVNADLLAFLNA
ncbi:alpha/beta hydrolase [Cupriavidus sp. CV2]|uniref:alpha/beta hydrolase n=1 Tax=Cupriavidus ulmosensis TaxID=3065913 RepID=UPI00296B0767|nr:alpha/beta hydrolase [Cupriavidus sp. CV2]MDW3685080.1 alpha/beta hydrolase [Cupriavidus sp. CV2]